MKTTFVFILTCIIGLLLTSCKPILIKLSGLKQPKIESVTSVSAYLKKNKIDRFDSLFVCHDSATLYKLITSVRDIPTTLLFDKQGLSIQQSDSGYCPGKVEEFMRTLGQSSSIHYDQRCSKQEILQWIHAVEGSSESKEEPDFTLCVFWAKYCGSLNNSVFRVMRAALENPAINVKIYMINTDFLDSWGMVSKPKFVFH